MRRVEPILPFRLGEVAGHAQDERSHLRAPFRQQLRGERIGLERALVVRVIEHFAEIQPVQAGIAEGVEVVRLDGDALVVRQAREVDAVLVAIELVRLVVLHGGVDVLDADERVARLLRPSLGVEHDVGRPGDHRLRELFLNARPRPGRRPHVARHVDLDVAEEHRAVRELYFSKAASFSATMALMVANFSPSAACARCTGAGLISAVRTTSFHAVSRVAALMRSRLSVRVCRSASCNAARLIEVDRLLEQLDRRVVERKELRPVDERVLLHGEDARSA